MLAAALLLFTLPTAAAAAAPAAPGIEGVWSYNGGQIVVQPAPNGKFVGIVVSPTKFATCTHPIGQEIWTGITLQTDGSYQGFHQWYFETAACGLNPTLGSTAWRVVEEVNGARYLRVCLSAPGTTQPKLPPNSEGVGASYGCESSALTAPLSGSAVSSFKRVVSLPNTKKCLSGRKFRIHIRNTQYDPFKSVLVTLKGRKIPVVHRGNIYISTVNLKGLPHGAFTVKIKAITVRGHQISGSRTYHTCTKRKTTKPKKRH
ncbi:MAG: hypothetical protein H0X28_00290 [Solirubrobacterales bacterium]|nr:hypothetical protein [Solirubrobacterales bacterium]